jgi:Na+/proline symporter
MVRTTQAPVFKAGRLENIVRILMVVSGVLSLAGLIGIPLADMQVRMIGVLGHAAVPPFAFLLVGIVFKRAQRAFGETVGNSGSKSGA